MRKINLIGTFVDFHPEKIKKEHHRLNGNKYYLHHILELILRLGKIVIMIVKIKMVRNLKEENVLKIYSAYRKMQADLYNLQPAIGEVNRLRSNYQIGIINGESIEFGNCDIELNNKIIEPTEQIRGNIARTYLYMEHVYPNYVIFNKNLKSLIKK